MATIFCWLEKSVWDKVSMFLFPKVWVLDGSRTVLCNVKVVVELLLRCQFSCVCAVLTFPLKAALDSLDFYLPIFILAGITDLFSSGALGVCWWAIDNLKAEGKDCG